MAMEKVILVGVQGGIIAVGNNSLEPIVFIPTSCADEFKQAMLCEGIETVGYQFGMKEGDMYEKALQTHMAEIIKAFKGET